MPLVPLTEEEAMQAPAPLRLVPVEEPAAPPLQLTPVDPLDDFEVFNTLEDEKEERGYDPADPGLAAKVWGGVKHVVGSVPGALRGAEAVNRVRMAPELAVRAVLDPKQTASDVATIATGVGKLLGNYNVLGKGAQTLAEKGAAAVGAMIDPAAENEMKRISRKATWDFMREVRDTEQFTASFNQHLETLFPQALSGLGSATVDQEASTGLAMIADPANFVPAGAAARWSTQVPLRGAVRAATAEVKAAGLEAARAIAEREALVTMLKPSLSAAERGPLFARYQAAEAAVKKATAHKETAKKVLLRTTNEQRAVVDQVAAEAAAQPLVTRGAAAAASGAGAAATAVGDSLQRVAALPQKIAGAVASTGDDAARESIADGVRNVAGLMGVVPAAAGVGASLAKNVGRNLSAFGRVLAEAEGQLPFFKRLARETDGLTSWGASLVDQSGLGAVIVPSAKVAADATRGVPFAAAQGYVSGGGNPDAAAAGAGGGIVFGMAGAGFGQWQRYLNGSLHRQRQTADVQRFRQTLASDEARTHFDQMPGADRAAMATMQLAHPDLSIKFERLGKARPSFYHVAEDGPVAVINLDTRDGVNAVVAHEIGHHVERHGLGPKVDQLLFGDPLLKRPGLFTELDASGQPLLDGAGGYVKTAEWAKLKEAYNARLRAHAERTGEVIRDRNDAGIAREVFAEHVADYMLGRDGALQGDLRATMWSRAMESLAESSLVGGVPMLRQVLGKLGLPLDGATRRVVGSDLFPGGLPASKDLTKLIRAYHRRSSRGHLEKIDDEPGSTRYTVDEVKKNPDVLEKLFDGTDDVKRDARGRPVRDKAGAPVFQSKKEQKAQRAELAKAIVAEIEKAPPPGARLENTAKDGEGWAVPGLPDPLIDSLEAGGKFNPHQIAHLRQVSALIREGEGKSALFFYQPALNPKGKYASLAGDWRTETPYQIFVSKAGNVLFRSVSREKLMANAQKFIAEKRGALWEHSLPALVADIDRYLANHAADRPGADGIGAAKRDQINYLFGIRTESSRSKNPFIDTSPKAAPFVRARRIDRTNRLTAVDAYFPADYEKVNANLRPERATAAGGDAPARPSLAQRQAEWRAAAEKIAPGVMQRFRLEFGDPDQVVQMGRANRRDITGAEEAAYLPAEKMLFLFDEALQKRSEVGTLTNLLHELGHAHHDTLPADRQAEILELFRAEIGDRKGPLFDDKGKLKRGVARGVETDVREFYAERLAFANRQWALRRKGKAPAAATDGLVGKMAQQFRDMLRQLAEWVQEIRGEKIDVDFREFLDAPASQARIMQRVVEGRR